MNTIDEEEEEEFSPIIRIFERLTFERGHEIHDQVSSLIELFSSSDVTLDMLDTLIECVKIIFVHPNIHKNMRVLDFLIILTHVTHLNYESNKNLALVFDALIDIFSQTMVAIDSQIRYTTMKILNKIQSFIDLSRSPYLPDQFEQYLLELLSNEPTLQVLDEVIPLAAKFQHRNEQFITAFLNRITSPKWLSYSDRRRQVISLLEYSPSSLEYLLSILENDPDFFQIIFESLLSDERGFTFDKIGDRGRSMIFKLASTSRDLSRFIFTRWINQNGGRELVDLLRICQISTSIDRENIEKTLRFFLADENIRRIVIKSIQQVIGTSKGGLLTSTTSKFIEYLFIWRILCQLQNEEDEDDDDVKIHPDFHELIAYFYRLIKSSVHERLSSIKQFTICQYASILSTFDMLDAYRRKCLEATGRCMLVHFGQYENIIQQAYQFIRRIHPSIDVSDERYRLITYILNDIIQRCQNEQTEKLAFLQCVTIVKVFVEQEKQLRVDYRDLKQLIDSLIKSGLSNGELEIQSQTLATLHSLMCHSRQMAVEYFKQILHINNKTNQSTLKCQSISTFIDVLLIHGLDILADVNLVEFKPMDYFLHLSNDRNVESQTVLIFGLIKLFLSGRLEPNTALLKIILDYRFSNDSRSIGKQQRDDITSFFYFFTHSSITNVLLMEELTFDLVSRSLPFISDATTVAYQSILIESMCYFCLELLSLPTLPIDQTHEEHSHYHLGKKLLQSIHQSNNHRTGFIIKSYLNTIKHLQFQYMNREQLEVLFDLIVQVRQYPNLPLVITSTIKHIEEQIQSNLKLIDKLTNGNRENKRPRSPSPSSSISTKRNSSSFNPLITSSPHVLQDRTNRMSFTNENTSSSKGLKRKSYPNRYATLDFNNDTEEFF